MTILVTGGAGYIGSHTCVELLNNNHDVIVVDNLCNSDYDSMEKVRQITGKNLIFYQIDIRNEKELDKIFENHSIDAVIHLAGLKAVGESVNIPQIYYENNIIGTLVLTRVMAKYNCKNIIFSSSATVYGKPAFVPITEHCPKGICTNPYGWCKWIIEQILTDLYNADNDWNIVILRYFNPIGAHKSGLIGENPKGIPNNLAPYISKVAVGKLDFVRVFGNDYNTIDGTGVRDYIHIVDLSNGHLKALNILNNKCGVKIYNLGTGKGYSVLQVIHAFEKACGHSIPYKITKRRAGDIDICYCDPTKARLELDWVTKYDIDDMCKDAYNWESKTNQ